MTESRETGAGFKSGRVGPGPRVFRTWVLAIGMPLALILLRTSDFGWTFWGFVCDVFIVLAWLLNTVWAVVLAVRLVRHKRWPGALLISILPVLLVAAMLMRSNPLGGSTPLKRTLPSRLIMSKEECHEQAKKVQCGVQA